MPCYFSISDWAPELSPLMVSAMNVPMMPLRGSSRGSAPGSLFWTRLPSLFEQHCFEVVTEVGVIVSPSRAG